MAVRLSIPPKSPIQGRTEQGLEIEQAIFKTTAGIRIMPLQQSPHYRGRQVRKSTAGMLD